MVKTPGGTRIAVFDIDRTLIIGTSAEEQLIRLLRRKKLLPLFNFLRNLGVMLRCIPLGLNQVLKRKSVYLHDLRVAQVHGFVDELYRDYLEPRLSRSLMERMEKLRAEGYEIIILSGTLDFIVEYLVKKLKADGGTGSPMEVRGGRFTGRIVGIHPYFHEKVKALHAYLGRRTIDFQNSTSFADSWADIPLLSLFGHPVAVNPGRHLRSSARRRGWEILEEELPEVKTDHV